jgi:hypothetical protein
MREKNFKLFKDYAQGIIKGIEQICFLDRMSAEDSLKITYATPDLAMAKYISNIQNGQDPGPGISIYLSNIELAKEQTMNGYGTLNIADGARYVAMRSPQICTLVFKSTIICNNETEGDLLQAQLIMGMPFNHNYYFMVDGQYACCYTENPENASSIEPGNSTDKINRRTCDIRVPRAYLEYPLYEIKSYIKEFNLSYNIIEGSSPLSNEPNDLISTYR